MSNEVSMRKVVYFFSMLKGSFKDSLSRVRNDDGRKLKLNFRRLEKKNILFLMNERDIFQSCQSLGSCLLPLTRIFLGNDLWFCLPAIHRVNNATRLLGRTFKTRHPHWRIPWTKKKYYNCKIQQTLVSWFHDSMLWYLGSWS